MNRDLKVRCPVLTVPACALLATVALGGCATRFSETHFFEIERPPGGGADTHGNFLKVEVSGGAWFSSARYVSGYYDERAVDLFFNELRSAPDGTAARPWFRSDSKVPGTNDPLKPLDPDAAHGAFVMIFSTNAAAVSETIGQFAENQFAADAITNLVNAREIRHLEGTVADVAVERSNRRAAGAEIAALLTRVPDGKDAAVEPPSPNELSSMLVPVMNAVNSQLGRKRAAGYLADAVRWFEEHDEVRR